MNRNSHWLPAVHSSRCKAREGGGRGGSDVMERCYGEREHVMGGRGRGGGTYGQHSSNQAWGL